MIRILLLSSCILCWLPSFSQTITTSTTQLDFGAVLETQKSTLNLIVSNTSGETIDVSAVLPLDEGYSVEPAMLTLAAQDADTFFVSFQPIHNVFHDQELILLPEPGLGAISIDLNAQGRYSLNYYSSTENKEGEALKTALKTRIGQGYVQLSYSGARDPMFMTIDNQKTNGQGAAVNTLECVYTGTLVTSYTSRTDAQLQGFNTEHTFPQGFFNQNLPMRSDIHHLFPTTVSSNSERGNKPFGTVSSPSWTVGGSKSNSSRFEPRDEQKGATARAMCYFVIRYQDYSNHFSSQETILRQWHKDFPPTAIDSARNEGIFAVQKNRNPFVDYPQFIDRMSTLVGTATVAQVSSYLAAEPAIDFDTITGPRVYSFPIVNTGNQPLTFQQPVFDDSRLSETSGISFPATVAVGEDLTIEITLNTIDNPGLDANMDMQVTGADDLSVPITAFWTLEASLENLWPEAWTFSSTPDGYEITFQSPRNVEWTLSDIQGKTIRSGVSGSQSLEVEMNGFSKGYYLLNLNSGEKRVFRRLLW